jgi:hypothetical protein
VNRSAALALALVYAEGALGIAADLPARKAEKPPVIDGRIDDDEWRGAAIAKDFIQFEPRRGEGGSVATEALVLYDATTLYVAFRAHDTEPPTAQLTQRDATLFDDDAVTILLDSYNDQRSAYYFTTNALGTQSDGRVADNGRTVDASWDAAWRSAAAKTAEGWNAEFAIPLASIKYASGDARVWRINFGRSRRRNLEISYWSGPPATLYQVSAAGTLSGLDVAAQKKRLEVVPYGLTQVQEGTEAKWELGGDARFAVTPQTSAYVTVNPDFATIEADQEQVNLTRFELSLPEKRPFFLEGNEQFQQRIRTFYSRRIADIDAGGKVLGKQGPWTFAALDVASPETPGARASNYGVARMQRDILGRSNVAAILSNRRRDGVDQGAVEVDWTLILRDTFNVVGQVVRTHGPFDRGTWAFFVRPSYDSSTGHFHVRYTHLGERVADNLNAIGFVNDDDRRELDSAASKTVWISSGRAEKVSYNSNYNVYWSQKGVLRSWKIDQSLGTDLRNRLSAGFKYTEEFKRFEKDFRNRQIGFSLGYNTREYQQIQVGYEFGRNFDSDYSLVTAKARYKLTAQLSAEYELQRLTRTPDPQGQSAWIHVVRANQFFTKDLFVKMLFQTNSSIDRRNLQAAFVYRYKPPFGTIQLAFQRGTAAFGQPSAQGNTLFLKVTSVF